MAWPIDGMPAVCLNSDGGTGECGPGLHIGTWGGEVNDDVHGEEVFCA